MSTIQGYFDPRFESVRELFAEQQQDEQARGAALCVTVGGETVLDLWQGVRDKDNQAVWEQDTLVNVFSCTKPLGAVALLQQVAGFGSAAPLVPLVHSGLEEVKADVDWQRSGLSLPRPAKTRLPCARF